ncbi:TIGR04211 family SH3 domain-containing protein [Desulfococcus sp.]|uniref:TIGR04211 family SH3 domain-containing protein n=1 Tax=Desulfococcus sp. TaxID=2025834 RepID=UPI003593EEDD
MKKVLSIGMLLLVFSTAALAERMYVSDKIRITVRTGPGIDFKVIAEAESGQMMDVQEERAGWSRVILTSGKEGWVLSRFLAKTRTRGDQVKTLQIAHDELKTQVDVLKTENETLKEENQKLDLLTGENRRALEEISHAYEVLKAESKDYLKLKSDYENAVSRIEEQKIAAERLKNRMEASAWKENAAFFIGGGVLVMLGFAIGALSRGGDKRRSSLL